LTLAPDGGVAAHRLTGPVSVTVDFDHDGVTKTATLFQGDAPASGQLSFTAQQVDHAEQATLGPPPPGDGGGSTGGGGGGGSPGITGALPWLAKPHAPKLVRHGSTLILDTGQTVRCAADGGPACVAIDTLTVKPVKRAAHPAAAKPLVIGRSRVAIAPGTSVRLRVKLNAKGRALAKRARLLHLTSTVELGRGAATAQRKSAKLSVRVPRRGTGG
jgi:hypothetical protein